MIPRTNIDKAAQLLARRDELIAERDKLKTVNKITLYRQGGFEAMNFNAQGGHAVAFAEIVEVVDRHIKSWLEANAQALRDLDVEVSP